MTWESRTEKTEQSKRWALKLSWSIFSVLPQIHFLKEHQFGQYKCCLQVYLLNRSESVPAEHWAGGTQGDMNILGVLRQPYGNVPSFRGLIALKVRISDWGKSCKPSLAASGSELDRIQPGWSRCRAALVCLHLPMQQTAISKVRRTVSAVPLTQAPPHCFCLHLGLTELDLPEFKIILFFTPKSHYKKNYRTIGECWSVLCIPHRHFGLNSSWHNLRAWTKLNTSCRQHKVTGTGR